MTQKKILQKLFAALIHYPTSSRKIKQELTELHTPGTNFNRQLVRSLLHPLKHLKINTLFQICNKIPIIKKMQHQFSMLSERKYSGHIFFILHLNGVFRN